MVRGSLPDIAVTMASGREIHGSFSLIVDDVDSQRMLSEAPELESTGCNSRNDSLNERNAKEEGLMDREDGPRERIKQIQVEAETRRDEFARLLEEHAQVVRKLKMMEAEEQLSSTAAGNAVVTATHA